MPAFGSSILTVNREIKTSSKYVCISASVTLSKRSKVNGLTNVKPGDGMLLYASGVGIIVCGVAQSTYTELLPNDVGADGVHTFWDVSLGDSWYKLANPISFQKMQILYGEIEVHQINSSVFPLTDIAAGKKLFAAAMKR